MKDIKLSQLLIKSRQWILAQYSFVLQGTKIIHAYNRSVTVKPTAINSTVLFYQLSIDIWIIFSWEPKEDSEY